MSNFLYTRPTERYAGTLAVNTGIEDAAYLSANLDDGFPHKPAKLTGTTGSWTRDLATSQQVDFAAIIHHNLAAGVVLKLQGHPTNTWGAPDVDLSYTILAAHADGFTKNVYFDVSALVPVAANRTKRFWRLFISTANTVPVAVGEWAVYSAIRNFGIRNISWGSERTLRRPALIHETELLVRRSYDLGTSIRGVAVDCETTNAVRDDIEAWHRASQGTVLPFVIVPNKDEDEPWFVTFMGEGDLTWTREHRNYNPLHLEFQEVSRGLTL